MITVNQKFAVDWAKSKIHSLFIIFQILKTRMGAKTSELLLAGMIANFSVLINDKGLSQKGFSYQKIWQNLLRGVSMQDGMKGMKFARLCIRTGGGKNNPEPNSRPWKGINNAEQVKIAYLLASFPGLQ